MESTAHGVAQLEAAFAAFSQISGSLEHAYGRLEGRVAELSTQLASERSKRLAELNEKEQLANRLTLLMNLLPGGVVVLGKSAEILEVNAQVHKWFGNDCVGQCWHQLIERLEQDANDPNLLLLESGARLSVTHQPALDHVGAILLLADVTSTFDSYERSSREARLVALGEMAARLAHQIRTPLSSALLGLSNIGHADVSDSDRMRMLARTSDRLRHIETLVSSMLSFVCGDQEGAETNDVATVLGDLVSTISLTARELNGTVSLTNRLPRNVKVLARREEFVSVLVAIAENGLVVADNPRLVILADLEEDFVVIDIADNGPGISKSDEARIFEPFYSARCNGTGLGLAIAARFARENGGELLLLQTDSTGSTFRLSLPVARATAEV